MTKFNRPVREALQRTVTHEGGDAVRPPTFEELVFTAATTYVGEDTFYEKADERLGRLVTLVRDATDRDPWAVARFVGDLRERFKIRGASIVVAAEYALRCRENGYPDRAPGVAQVVDAACQRADEPAEFIAYWRGKGLKTLPAGVRRGLAAAVVRLYTPKSVLKWDGRERGVRMADVLELVHPDPRDQEQRSLFKWLLDQRHHNDVGPAENERGEKLDHLVLHDVPVLAASYNMGHVAEDQRRTVLREQGARALADAGYTWERLAGWLPGGMDREAWEAVIPQMGVMALIRNLRNFDDAGISDEAVERVIAKITSPEDVAGSKILPYRAYTAYVHAPSDNWKRALGWTVDLASGSVPELDQSLLLVDTSGSMQSPVSGRSRVSRVVLAALQALTLARRSRDCDVVLYAQDAVNLDQVDDQWRRRSVLSAVERVHRSIGIVGHATYGHTAISRHYDSRKHTKVLLFTDDQQHDSETLSRNVPKIVTFDVGGYGRRSTWGKRRAHVTGLSDQVFTVVAELLRG